MTKSGYALLTGVCIKIDTYISIVCPRDFCWLSDVAISNSVAVLAAQLKITAKSWIINIKPISTFSQRLRDQAWECTVYWCLLQNRFPHFHHMSTWYFWFSAVAICNIERRHHLAAHRKHGVPRRLHDQESVCTAYWCLYQNRHAHFGFPSYVRVIPAGWALLQYRTPLPSWQRN